MNENKRFKHFTKCLILSISLIMIALPTFAEEKVYTLDEAIGHYTGTMMNAERGTLVEATVEKTSDTTGFVTISGIEGQVEATKYFMTFDKSNSNFRLYPNTINKNTTDLDDIPFACIGVFIDGGMFGQHAFYNKDETMLYPTNNMTLHKVIAPKILLTEDEIDTKSPFLFKFIDSELGITTLDNSRIEFYEYESGFSSMKIAFTTESSKSSYSYMITLPKAVDVHSISKSSINAFQPPFDGQFGCFVASRISSDHYGPWSCVDSATASELKKSYESAILNQLSDESILGRTYYHYNSFAGVLAGSTAYELEIVFNGALEDLFSTINDKKAAIYIGGAEGELLVDNFKFAASWHDFEGLLENENSDETHLENNCIKNAPLNMSKVEELLGDLIYDLYESKDIKIFDKEKMTLNNLNKIVSLSKNDFQSLVTIEDADNMESKFFAAFDADNQLEFFMTKSGEIILVQLRSENKIGFIELNTQTGKGVYNEYLEKDYNISNDLKKLLESAELLLQRSLLIKK